MSNDSPGQQRSIIPKNQSLNSRSCLFDQVERRDFELREPGITSAGDRDSIVARRRPDKSLRWFPIDNIFRTTPGVWRRATRLRAVDIGVYSSDRTTGNHTYDETLGPRGFWLPLPQHALQVRSAPVETRQISSMRDFDVCRSDNQQVDFDQEGSRPPTLEGINHSGSKSSP